MIGLERNKVKLLPHNTNWSNIFKKEKKALEKVIGDNVLKIEHVGSTSIPGIPAKPIIDIAIAIEKFEEAIICINPIKSLGYEYLGENGIPRRHFFIKGEPRTFHIHMNEIKSIDWNNQINFRDYLRNNSGIAKEYAELKLKLAKKYPENREKYLMEKAPFIERVLGQIIRK